MNELIMPHNAGVKRVLESMKEVMALPILVVNLDVELSFVCEGWLTVTYINLMPSLTIIHLLKQNQNCGNRNSVLTSRLPIQTGLLP